MKKSESGSSVLTLLLVVAFIATVVIWAGPYLKKRIYQNVQASITKSSKIESLERKMAKQQRDRGEVKENPKKRKLVLKKASPAAIAKGSIAPRRLPARPVQRRYVSSTKPAPRAVQKRYEMHDGRYAPDESTYEDLSLDLAAPRPSDRGNSMQFAAKKLSSGEVQRPDQKRRD